MPLKEACHKGLYEVTISLEGFSDLKYTHYKKIAEEMQLEGYHTDIDESFLTLDWR